MRKRTIILSVAILVIFAAAAAGGYVMFFSGGTTVVEENPHFSVAGITVNQSYFAGDTVIVKANVTNDEPQQEVPVPTTVSVIITADPSNSSSRNTTGYVATTVPEMVGPTGTHPVTAELKGFGVDILRTVNLTLESLQSKTVTFGFGQVPTGSYVLTVTAQSYNDSVKSKAIVVNAAPALDDWTDTGDIAFMFVNLSYEGVDVLIRNDGVRSVNFGSGQYVIFANSSDDVGVVLPGINQTLVQPGETISVHAHIPARGNYYLDYFAIKAPLRESLLKVMVLTWMNTTS